VLNSDPAQDHAAANLGQLMYIADKAAAEFRDKLPQLDLSQITGLVSDFHDPAIYRPENYSAAVNIGQLKYVAQPFYDVLDTPLLRAAWPAGMTSGPYPWSADTADDRDHALANIGQLKYVFSFDFSKVDFRADGDLDGMPDWWEFEHGFDPHHAADALLDADADGLTTLNECLNGANPLNADSDGDRLIDGREVVGISGSLIRSWVK
jgi:hypothetical protein